MSAKELMLIPKQKYNQLTEKLSLETVSVQTQTSDDNQPEMKSENEQNNSLLNDQPDNKVIEEMKTVQAVRSSSWDRVPGKIMTALKLKPKKTVKWIPY